MKKGLHLTTQQISPHRSRIKSTLVSPIHSLHAKKRPHNYFNQTMHPKSYAQQFQKSLQSTLQRSNTQLDFNNITVQQSTPGKRNKQYLIDSRVKTLQEWGSRRNIRHQQQIIAHRMSQLKKLQEKPTINNRSKQLYRSVSKKKNLNKDIISRFKFYESERVKKNIDNIVKTFIKETKQVPTIKQLLKTNKKDVIDLLRNIRV